MDELVPVGSDGDEINPEAILKNGKETPTSITGGTIIRPDSQSITQPTPDEPGADVLILEDEERPDDTELIQRTVDMFVKGHYLAADIDRPTFERNKTMLYTIPLLSEQDFVRSKLND